MTDKDILTLINSLSSLEDSKKVVVAILLLSTIMSSAHAEQTAGFMVGLNEVIDDN